MNIRGAMHMAMSAWNSNLHAYGTWIWPVHDVRTNIRRVGLRMLMPGVSSSLRWFGRGPYEIYPDRKSSAVVGTHASTVSEQFTPYIRPSECGARSDVHWLEPTHPRALPSKPSDTVSPRPSEAAVLFAIPNVDGEGEYGDKSGESMFPFSELPYLAEDLSGVAHPEELPRTRMSTAAVSLDHRLMGVSGDDSWSACVHDEFLVRPGLFRFAFAVPSYWREIDHHVDEEETVRMAAVVKGSPSAGVRWEDVQELTREIRYGIWIRCKLPETGSAALELPSVGVFCFCRAIDIGSPLGCDARHAFRI